MSFGLSPGDILRGTELCISLYKNCLNPSRSAHESYTRFRDDVERFGEALKALGQRLETSLGTTNDSYRWAEPCDGIAAKDILGDFRATLKECREFLCSHSKLQSGSNAWRDFYWGLFDQPRVQEFHNSIKDHMLTTYFLINSLRPGPVENDVSEVLERVRHSQGVDVIRHEIDERLRGRFCEALSRDAPSSYAQSSCMDLRDGFHAMIWHFNRSTFIADDGHETIEQYLALLKAHFLLEELKLSRAFRNARPGSHWRRAILETGQRINVEYEKDFQQYHVDTLLGLGEAAFRIWRPPRPRAVIESSDVLEIQIDKLPLKTTDGTKQNLVLFRRIPTGQTAGSKDFADLKLMREIYPEGSDVPERSSDRIRARSAFLIPRYAPDMLDSNLLIELRGCIDTFEFQKLRDACTLQQALLGYHVAFNANDISWSLDIRRRGVIRPSKGFGRLQIWQWEPLQGAALTQPTSPSISSHSSDLSEVLEGLDQSSLTIVSQRPDRHVVAQAESHPPRLVIFNTVENSYAFISIDLDRNHRVVSDSCECKHRPDVCCVAVVENKSNKSRSTRKDFPVKRFDAGPNGMDQWSLSVLGRPASDDLQPHRDNAASLTMLFYSPLERQKFNNNLDMVMTLKEVEDRRVHKVDSYMMASDDRPTQSSPRPSSSRRSSASAVNVSPNSSTNRRWTAPTLPPQEALPSLSETMFDSLNGPNSNRRP